jgi:hypothetical protein
VPHDVIVPGILESADIGDMVAALAPRAVLLQGFVDGRNRPLRQTALEGELATALAAYRGAVSPLVVREDAAPQYLAGWIVGHLSRP